MKKRNHNLLSKEEVQQIRKVFKKGNMKQADLADAFQVLPNVIFRIINNLTYKNI